MPGRRKGIPVIVRDYSRSSRSSRGRRRVLWTHSTSRTTSSQRLASGSSQQSNTLMPSPSPPADQDFADGSMDNDCPEERENTSRSSRSYIRRVAASDSAWDGLNPILTSGLRSQKNRFPSPHCAVCHQAPKDNIVLMCRDCPASIESTCYSCSAKTHKLSPHVIERWTENGFVTIKEQLWSVCSCPPSISAPKIILMNDQGLTIDGKVNTCCFSVIDTCLRMGYWPGTPSVPTIAFSFGLMDWLYLWVLGGVSSITSFVDALGYKNGCNLMRIYNVLRVSFRRYMEIKRSSSIKIDHCLGCMDGHQVYAMDGCFGLVCKRDNSDEAKSSPFFLDTAAVRERVERDLKRKPVKSQAPRSCSHFQAGDVLRSKTKTARLPVKGMFGVVCKHDAPVMLTDMLSHESHTYPILCIEELRARHPNNKLTIFYDVACRLTLPQALRDEVTLMLPIMHMYAHKRQCRTDFNPRLLPSIGLVDGEGTERLWAQFRRFASITKEMRGDTRRRLFSELCYFMLEKQTWNLEHILDGRLKKADLIAASEEEMNKIPVTEPTLSASVADIDGLTDIVLEITWLNGVLRSEARGQYMANRLISALKNQHSKAQKLITEYNIKNGTSIMKADIIKTTNSNSIPSVDPAVLRERAIEERVIVTLELQKLRDNKVKMIQEYRCLATDDSPLSAQYHRLANRLSTHLTEVDFLVEDEEGEVLEEDEINLADLSFNEEEIQHMLLENDD